MLVALDANVVIYLIEANPRMTPTAAARLAALRAAGDEIAFCDAGRLECLVKPMAQDNATDIAAFRQFFSSPQVKMLPVTAAVWERAAHIRAEFRLKPLDSIHLASAIEHGCGMFLTNDAALQRFSGIRLEVLV